MPRTKYHAKIEQDRESRKTAKLATINNTEDVTVMTTNETNGNGQVLSTANLNKLASALGEPYNPETTIEDMLFSDQPSNPLLGQLAKVLGANESALSSLLINDCLTGNGDKVKLLRSILDDIKQQQLNQQKRAIQDRKQFLLDEVQSLDTQLNGLPSVTGFNL